MTQKKVLVTGGAGFIASHIVDFLIKKEYTLTIIDNLSTGKKEYLNPKAIFYNADITKALEINNVFEKEKPDIVIHLAAQVMLRKSLENPIFDATTNILGTINILEACKKYSVKRIIYTSTGGARVGEPKYLPVDENHPIEPLSPYGISKHTAEHYVAMYNKLYNLDYLIFCFGNVYGPRDDPKCNRVTSLFTHLLLNNIQPKIFGDGNQTRDFIFVTDLAEFIVNSIEKNPQHKLFHLANSVPISVNDIFIKLKKLTNSTLDPIFINAIKGEVRDIVLDTTLAKNELNWSPKHNIDEGLEETVKWLKENQVLFK